MRKIIWCYQCSETDAHCMMEDCKDWMTQMGSHLTCTLVTVIGDQFVLQRVLASSSFYYQDISRTRWLKIEAKEHQGVWFEWKDWFLHFIEFTLQYLSDECFSACFIQCNLWFKSHANRLSGSLSIIKLMISWADWGINGFESFLQGMESVSYSDMNIFTIDTFLLHMFMLALWHSILNAF